MINKADIIAKLQEGVDIETLASQFSEVLNEAQAEYEQIQKEEAKSLQEKAKVQAIYSIIDGMIDYCVAAGREELIQELRDTDVEQMIAATDGLLNIVAALKEYNADTDIALTSFLDDWLS